MFVNGRLVEGPSISRGVIFQNHSLLPWKTALGNVTFSVRARWPQWSRSQIREHSLRYLHLVGLQGRSGAAPAGRSCRGACASGWGSPAPSPSRPRSC